VQVGVAGASTTDLHADLARARNRNGDVAKHRLAVP
jgi:hypothetical protein